MVPSKNVATFPSSTTIVGILAAEAIFAATFVSGPIGITIKAFGVPVPTSASVTSTTDSGVDASWTEQARPEVRHRFMSLSGSVEVNGPLAGPMISILGTSCASAGPLAAKNNARNNARFFGIAIPPAALRAMIGCAHIARIAIVLCLPPARTTMGRQHNSLRRIKLPIENPPSGIDMPSSVVHLVSSTSLCSSEGVFLCLMPAAWRPATGGR